MQRSNNPTERAKQNEQANTFEESRMNKSFDKFVKPYYMCNVRA